MVATKPAYAHNYGDNFLFIQQKSDRIDIEWSLLLEDLVEPLAIDTNQDGRIQAFELDRKKTEINNKLANYLLIASKEPCQLNVKNASVIQRDNKAYYSIYADSPCQLSSTISIQHQLFNDSDPNSKHTTFITYRAGDKASPREEHIISKEGYIVIDTHRGNNTIENTWQFFKEGVWHIWGGIDHILFLLTLLPIVLNYQQRMWKANKTLKQSLTETLVLTSLFTLSHSITLSLATLGVINIHAGLIETLIALSIIIVAINNIKPFFTYSTPYLCFTFGLIHGLGFANFLSSISLNSDTLLSSLVGFNLGVEIGQILIITLLFPVIFWLRQFKIYRNWGIPIAMMTIILLSSLWTIERSINLPTII